MKFDLSRYDQLPDSDTRKTYELLMSFIVTQIKPDTEKRNMQEKEKAWNEVTNPSKPGAKAEKEKANTEKEKKEKGKLDKAKEEKKRKKRKTGTRKEGERKEKKGEERQGDE